MPASVDASALRHDSQPSSAPLLNAIQDISNTDVEVLSDTPSTLPLQMGKETAKGRVKHKAHPATLSSKSKPPPEP